MCEIPTKLPFFTKKVQKVRQVYNPIKKESHLKTLS